MANINKSIIGRYVAQKEGYKAFTPYEFPPKGGFAMSSKLHRKYEAALLAVGKLNGVVHRLPDKTFFLWMFLNRDAAHSAQIEGTQATLQDAVAAPVTEEKSRLHPDFDDITHYVGAVEYGIERIKTFPISLRFIRELHEKLMVGARSTQHAYPGEFRTSQNWIGGKSPSDASFVPPAPHDMQAALADLEEFMYAEDEYPLLIKAGLIHAQFETIHPFTDGNGRTGRMLTAMYMHHTGVLEMPVLYLSSYFKQHKKLYYQKLQNYHDDNGDVEGWLDFFLDGVVEIAASSIDTCMKITELRDRDFEKAQQLGKRSAKVTVNIVRKLYSQPIVGVREIMKWTGYSLQGSYNVIERLKQLGILENLGSVEYGQKYVYADYYELFDETFRDARKRGKKKA